MKWYAYLLYIVMIWPDQNRSSSRRNLTFVLAVGDAEVEEDCEDAESQDAAGDPCCYPCDCRAAQTVA